MNDTASEFERRECLDHIIVSGEGHLRRNLISYAAYYNSVRTHRSLHKDAPIWRPVQRTESSHQIRSLADFIITTSESRFSVYTGVCRYASRRRALRSDR